MWDWLMGIGETVDKFRLNVISCLTVSVSVRGGGKIMII
jgi:hypothetical protein